MKKLQSTTIKQSFIFGALIGFALLISACATFKKPVTINKAPILERALTKEENGIRVSASVLGDDEARQIFGIDLAHNKIQAVWIEIENNTDRPILLLPTAIDPDYFAPLEVAYAFHKAFAADANAALNEHLLKLNFPIRRPVADRARVLCGYIFTNWTKGMKVVDVDLLGDNFSQNFHVFYPQPGLEMMGQDIINACIESMFAASELQNVESEAALRQALEQLSCCVSNEIDGPFAEPLNVVIIGALEEWTTAFIRRGYRYQALESTLCLRTRPGYIREKTEQRVYQGPGPMPSGSGRHQYDIPADRSGSLRRALAWEDDSQKRRLPR